MWVFLLHFYYFMKEKNKKILRGITILILLIIVINLIVVIPAHSKIKDYCKEKCTYIAIEQRGLFEKEYIAVSYWRFDEYSNYKKFETQKQCIDYCFDKEKDRTGWKHFTWMKYFLQGFFGVDR